MNRRELLRELSRAQATWVNRNTPGSGDINPTAEQEQDYLVRISAVIERAREEVRRKRSPVLSADAMAATRIIDALLAGFDKDQPRDSEGRWGGGALGVPALSRKDDPLGLAERIRLEPSEALRGSARVRTNSGGGGDTLLAAISGPDGPQARFATLLSEDAQKWAAGNKGATAKFEGAEDVARLASELSTVADAAKAARDDLRSIGAQLDREGVWDRDDSDLTPEQLDRRAAFEVQGNGGLLAEGVIPGSDWGDVHWVIQGEDIGIPGEEEVLVQVLVRPLDERDMPWDEMSDGVTGIWSPALYDVTGASRLAKVAAKMAGAAQTAVTAAGSMAFNPDQARDAKGRWGSGVGRAITKPLSGKAALESAPVRLIRPPGGHGGDYTGADITGPPGHGGALALAEMEGVEHEVTNNHLRNVGKPPPRGYRPPSPEQQERIARIDKEIADRVADLDRTMAVSPLPEPVVVYRGVKDGSNMFRDAWYGKYADPNDSLEKQDEMWELWEAGERPDLTGVTWEEKAYSHTTVNGGRLAGYARKIADMEPVAMTITVPAGTGAVQMSEIDHEAELMLERGLRYRVVADHGVDDGGVRRLDVEVLPHG